MEIGIICRRGFLSSYFYLKKLLPIVLLKKLKDIINTFTKFVENQLCCKMARIGYEKGYT